MVSGITTGFLTHKKWRGLMAAHLSRLALQCWERKQLTGRMRESLISIMYKGGEKPRDRCTSYRPVSLTDAAARILARLLSERHQGAQAPLHL